MTDTNPFFRFVWRVNALIILGGALAVATLIAVFVAREIWDHFKYRPVVIEAAPADSGSEPGGDDKPAEAERFDLKIGQFQPSGAIYFAPLHRVAREGVRARVSIDSTIHKKEYGPTALNLLFFDPATGVTKRLLPDDKGLILEWSTVRDDYSQTEAVRALLLTYVEKDTDGDKLLTASDEKRIILARPDGSATTVLADGVQALDGTWRSRNSAVLRYFTRIGEEIRYGEVDLDSFAIKPAQAVQAPKP